jgi:DNA-binding NarL/FixJ family response regulator
VRVIACEDHAALRRRLVLALEEDPDIHVVAEAVDGSEAVAVCGDLSPDAVIVGMVDDPAHLIAALRATLPAAGLVALTSGHDERAAVDALRAGATGFVNRETLGQAPAVVRLVSAGGVALPPLLAASLLGEPGAVEFSADERRAVEYLGAGYTYRAVAHAFGLAASDVKELVAGAVRRLQHCA